MIPMHAAIPGLPTVPETIDWYFRVRDSHPDWPLDRVLAELRRLPDLDPDAVAEAARTIYRFTDD